LIFCHPHHLCCCTLLNGRGGLQQLGEGEPLLLKLPILVEDDSVGELAGWGEDPVKVEGIRFQLETGQASLQLGL